MAESQETGWQAGLEIQAARLPMAAGKAHGQWRSLNVPPNKRLGDFRMGTIC